MTDTDPRFEAVLSELREIHRRKSADYGRTDDPFANVRASEEWGVPGWVGTLIRANDKVRRLQAAANGSELQNEGVEDSLVDLATYAIIALVLFRDEKPITIEEKFVDSDVMRFTYTYPPSIVRKDAL